MDLFVVIYYIECDDYYYGYNQRLQNIFPAFDQAKQYVDSYLLKFVDCDGKSGNPFIEIIGMKWGETNTELLFSSKT